VESVQSMTTICMAKKVAYTRSSLRVHMLVALEAGSESVGGDVGVLDAMMKEYQDNRGLKDMDICDKRMKVDRRGR
jgi:hypothetical protein